MHIRTFSVAFLTAFLLVGALIGPAASSSVAGTSNASPPAQIDVEPADLTFSFFACPDGFNPYTVGDAASTCTEPAPASSEAALTAPPDLINPVSEFTQIDTGVYSHRVGSGYPFHLSSFFPEGFNASLVEGNGVTGGYIWPVPNDDSIINVYGYNQPEGTGLVGFSFYSCPDDFAGPEGAVEPFYACNEPIDAPANADATTSTGETYPLADATRTSDGTYIVNGLTLPASLTLHGFEIQGTDIGMTYPAEEWVRDNWIVDTDAPTMLLNVYVWNEDSATTSDEPVGGGSIHLTLLSCPEGVDPTAPDADPGADCSQTIQPTGDAALTWDGGQTRLDSLQPDQYGSFTISQLPLDTPITFTDLEPSARGAWTAVGVDDWNENGEPYVTITGTNTVNIALYYYDEQSGSTPEEPASEGTVHLSLRGCPEGIDPTGVAAGSPGTRYCDNVIQATGDAALAWDGGEARLDTLTPDENGNYTIRGLPLNQTITFVDLQPSSSDSWMAEGIADWTTDGDPFLVITGTETVYVNFYYYNEILAAGA